MVAFRHRDRVATETERLAAEAAYKALTPEMVAGLGGITTSDITIIVPGVQYLVPSGKVISGVWRYTLNDLTLGMELQSKLVVMKGLDCRFACASRQDGTVRVFVEHIATRHIFEDAIVPVRELVIGVFGLLLSLDLERLREWVERIGD